MSSYQSEAISDAQSTAREYLDEILESYLDNGGEASDDLLNDYGNGDAYHHESHTDKSYSLLEAAELLNELSDHEETDSGLWESQKPQEAVCSQAAYTYANAVMHYWKDLIDDINGDDVLTGLQVDFESIEQEVTDELEEALDAARDAHLADDSDDEFDEESYDTPFDEDDEVEARKAVCKAKIKARIEAIIDGYDG
jgi:hypothetical protein